MTIIFGIFQIISFVFGVIGWAMMTDAMYNKHPSKATFGQSLVIVQLYLLFMISFFKK